MPLPGQTEEFTRAIRSSATDEVILILVELHPPTTSSGFQTLRYVANDEDIISNGHIFTAAGMKFSLPKDTADEMPRSTVAIHDPEQTIVQSIRLFPVQTGKRPTVSGAVILAGDPNTIQRGWFGAQLLEADYGDGDVVMLYIGNEDLMSEGYPGLAITPKGFPGLG